METDLDSFTNLLKKIGIRFKVVRHNNTLPDPDDVYYTIRLIVDGNSITYGGDNPPSMTWYFNCYGHFDSIMFE